MRKQNLLVRVLVAMMLLPVIGLAWTGTDFNPPKYDQKSAPGKMGDWAKASLDSMSLDEKIGQLFMVAAYSNKDENHYARIEKLIRKEKIGGLIFMQGGPGRQISLANRYQNASRFPLLISQDSEWGLSMRLDSTVRFPHNMTLGAIRDSLVIFELGMEIGRECRRVGVHVNFAPVVDVNCNPLNPVINDRSFGENPRNVANKGIYIYKGMEFTGTIGCAKHFPGHGDTDTDSHKDLPIIPFDRARLDSIELYPFRKLFESGVASVMVAHLYIPSLDSTANLASTLSPKIVTDLLKNELGFKGLIFTDALGMKGVTKFWEEGETDLKAFLAGNDVLLFSGNVSKAKQLIREAIEKGEVSEKELDSRVLKILVAKEWAGLHRNRIVPQVVPGEMDSPTAHALAKRLYQQAITLVKNDKDMIPLTGLEKRKIAVVEIGTPNKSAFYRHLRTYSDVDYYHLAGSSDKASRDKVLAALKGTNTVIVGVDGMSKSARKGYGISAGTKSLLSTLKQRQGVETAVVLFGSPYSLKLFGKNENALLVAYEDNEDAMTAAAEAIFGGIRIDGVLPVTASPQFPEGSSIVRQPSGRFQFSIPEGAGMQGSILNRIDSIAQAAIKMEATPGMSILVMRGNKIVFDRGYGKTEYGKPGKKIKPYETLYDLASVTKIAATTVSTMKLVQDGKIRIDDPVSAYLSDFRGRNLTQIKVKNLLLHNAGFRSWIPFYKETFDSTGALDKNIYQTAVKDSFCVPVIDGLYMCTDFQDSMWVKIMNSNIRTDHKVRYSDLSMIVLRRVIESAAGVPFDRFVDSVFYKPMGMSNTGFNPALTMPGKLTPPTEMDNYWRNKKVQGYVHDQASAMLGGVSGHAGLFSNVYDLAKIMLMVKNGGQYADNSYFDKKTVSKFTAKQLTRSRKGLGWDKPEPSGGGPTSGYCSAETYGHTGFTGIGVWVDPQYDLVYIFLSNRTFPSAENKKLIRKNIRPAIQDLIYESIFAYEGRDLAMRK